MFVRISFCIPQLIFVRKELKVFTTKHQKFCTKPEKLPIKPGILNLAIAGHLATLES